MDVEMSIYKSLIAERAVSPRGKKVQHRGSVKSNFPISAEPERGPRTSKRGPRLEYYLLRKLHRGRHLFPWNRETLDLAQHVSPTSPDPKNPIANNQPSQNVQTRPLPNLPYVLIPTHPIPAHPSSSPPLRKFLLVGLRKAHPQRHEQYPTGKMVCL